MINILIADDQNFVRKTLESYLEPESDINVIGFAENGAIAIEQVATLKPDVVLMDIEMPVMDGLTATKTIVEKFEETKVLILTIHDKEEHLVRALKIGVKGYWLKNTTAQELADIIRYVHKGYFQLAKELIEKHFERNIVENSPSKQNLLVSEQENIVNLVLDRIERQVGSLKDLTPQNLHETIENIIKQELTLRKEKDANFQFRVDRLKNRLNALEKNYSLATKIQLFINLILIVAVSALGYLFLNS